MLPHTARVRRDVRALEAGPRVDIVVTDVVMPGMDGGRLWEIIGLRFPGTRILYTSGYTDDVLVRRGLQSDRVAFLAKPYSPAALLVAVRSVLDRVS